MKYVIRKVEEILTHKITMLLFILVIAVFLIIWIFYNKDSTTNTHINYISSFTGFILTALGFSFVVVQISTLAEQVQHEKERHNKDSEFKNFLEATKMLTSFKNKDNTEAKISAMYLLYDFAKNYPENNLEKVMKILNRYVTPIYKNSTPNTEITTGELITDRRTINEWREKGVPEQQVASVALELNKKLFAYALEKELENISLSSIVIFDFDIERNINSEQYDSYKIFNFSNTFKNNSGSIFLNCKFAVSSKKEISFLSNYKEISDDSVKNRMDVTLSKFICCDLEECDFSYSNLWGVSFEDCNLKNTKFKKAECEAVQFLGKTKIKLDQIKRMLFIDKDKYPKEISYGIIYSENIEKENTVNKNCFFSDTEEYNKFKNG